MLLGVVSRCRGGYGMFKYGPVFPFIIDDDLDEVLEE